MINPEISVITTVYNCEDFVEESIQSILNQTYKNFEYIIVNDGSTDNTTSILNKFAGKDDRIRVIDNPVNLGRVTSLNLALRSATGKFAAIQDADDVSLPDRLDFQLSFLTKNPDYVLVGSDVTVIDESGKVISNPVRPETDQEAKFSLIFRSTFANPSIMYLKKIIDENGIFYDEKFLHAEDFRIISQISRYGKVHNLKERLVLYRKHPRNNSSVNADILSSASIRIARENISRLGFSVSEDQVRRIRNLISSRGMERQFLLDDVKLVFKIIRTFQGNQKYRNEEILKTLKRMSKWLGWRNLILRPQYMACKFYILTYYFKQFNFDK